MQLQCYFSNMDYLNALLLQVEIIRDHATDGSNLLNPPEATE